MAEGACLEYRCASNRTVGSNPTLSAVVFQNRYIIGYMNNFIKKVLNLKQWVIWAEKVGEGVSSKWGLIVYRIYAFAESIIIPIPTDIILAFAVYTNPEKIWRFVRITILWSVFGGVAGYFLGAFFSDYIFVLFPETSELISNTLLDVIDNKFKATYINFVFALSPIFPYKIMTFGSGALSIGVLYLIIGSVLGRTIRYSLVALIVKYFGKTAYKLGWKSNIAMLLISVIFFYLLTKINI